MLKGAVEENYKMKLGDKHQLLAWIVEHSGSLLTRYAVGKDGRTAWELWRGKPWRGVMVELEEQIWFMPVRSGERHRNKFEGRWEEGAFVGVVERTGEIRVMTESGVLRTRSIRRKPAASRWDAAMLAKQKGFRGSRTPGAARPISCRRR